jgi:hypothetical protein
MRSKGQSAAVISEFITAFFAIAIVIFMYFMFQGRYLDVQVIVEGNEVERRAINAAQVLMSSKDVVWQEGTGAEIRFYRGVFDKAKLDEQMVSKSQYDNDKLLDRGRLKEYLTYPGTVTEITIRSGDTEDAWFTAFADYGNTEANGFYTCLASHIDLDFQTHYEECQKTYMSSSNRFEKSFPVLVRDAAAGGTLHPAIMTIVMTSN